MKRPIRATLVVALAVAITSVLATTAAGGAEDFGFQTEAPPFLVGSQPGVSVKPLITVGDTIGSYTFESIPDGISIRNDRPGRWDVYVNHELSLVPFLGRSDFTNSIVSRLTMNNGGRISGGEYVIPSSANYQRFCSNFLATSEHGFDRDLLLTNEEARDYVNRTGTAWPPGPGAEQPGVVVALDVETGAYRSIYGMGRHNHENSVAVPGYGHPVVLSGDDTFVSNPPESQLYLYTAADADAVWDDEGTLHAFVVDGKQSYYDVTAGEELTGHFVEVPEPVASGKLNGSDVTTDDFPTYDTPPAGVPDGPQWILDQWGNAENNTFGEDVFDFVRIEDIAYDRNDPNVVYLADSGSGSGSLARPNGRIWKMVLDPDDPTQVTSLTILVEGSNLLDQLGDIHQPDNLETTERSLLIQEDPSTGNQFATPARIWRYDLESGDKEVVATMDPTVGTSPRPGSWESSGVVDASAMFGQGAFLVDVQAHGWEIDTEPGDGFEYRKEAGQLLLLRIPGA
jgi:hypothetical protein